MANDLPPGVVEVDRTPAANGGWWVLGNDGGVFAVGGASFYGSYPGLAPDARQGDRMGWERIEPTEEGGYALVSGKGERYLFNPPPSQKPVSPVSTEPAIQADPAGPTQGTDAVSGTAIVEDVLKRYGLDPQLGKEMLNHYNTGGDDYMMIQLRNTDQYKKRFSGMEARRAAGYNPINEAQYIEWEGQTKALFDHYGLPKDFYDQPEELAQFIAGDVSVPELKDRVEKGYAVALSADPQVKQALQQMYGVDDASLVTFFLDPTKGEEIIQKRWTAAQIGGAAIEANFGSLSTQEAEKLATKGMSAQQAGEGFGILEQQKELFGATPGESVEGTITRDEQLGAISGDVSAAEKIKRKGKQRASVFEGGGQYAGGQSGISGLGEAT